MVPHPPLYRARNRDPKSSWGVQEATPQPVLLQREVDYESFKRKVPVPPCWGDFDLGDRAHYLTAMGEGKINRKEARRYELCFHYWNMKLPSKAPLSNRSPSMLPHIHDRTSRKNPEYMFRNQIKDELSVITDGHMRDCPFWAERRQAAKDRVSLLIQSNIDPELYHADFVQMQTRGETKALPTRNSMSTASANSPMNGTQDTSRALAASQHHDRHHSQRPRTATLRTARAATPDQLRISRARVARSKAEVPNGVKLRIFEKLEKLGRKWVATPNKSAPKFWRDVFGDFEADPRTRTGLDSGEALRLQVQLWTGPVRKIMRGMRGGMDCVPADPVNQRLKQWVHFDMQRICLVYMHNFESELLPRMAEALQITDHRAHKAFKKIRSQWLNEDSQLEPMSDVEDEEGCMGEGVEGGWKSTRSTKQSEKLMSTAAWDVDDMDGSGEEEDDDTEMCNDEDASSDSDSDRGKTAWGRSSKFPPSLSLSQIADIPQTASTPSWLSTPQLPSLPSSSGTKSSSIDHSSGYSSSKPFSESSQKSLQSSLGFSRPQATPAERARADRVARNILRRPGGTTQRRLFEARQNPRTAHLNCIA